MEIARARLKAVLREPGCALCRLRLQAEQRYYAQILFDRVNDGELRLRLARSSGFCAAHTRGLLRADMVSEPPGLGFAILHAAQAALLRETLNACLSETACADTAPSPRRMARRHSLTDGIARLLPERDRNLFQERLLASLSPTATCPACESVAASEQVFVRALVRDLATTDLGAAYGASDGLCLGHLRQALACARDDETVTLLTRQAGASLARLVSDLEAYLDSLARPGEPRPAATPSLMRAAAFFAGHGHESD
jgi:hypothetical protein